MLRNTELKQPAEFTLPSNGRAWIQYSKKNIKSQVRKPSFNASLLSCCLCIAGKSWKLLDTEDGGEGRLLSTCSPSGKF